LSRFDKTAAAFQLHVFINSLASSLDRAIISSKVSRARQDQGGYNVLALFQALQTSLDISGAKGCNFIQLT